MNIGREVYRFIQVPGIRPLICRRCRTHISVDREAVLLSAERLIGFFRYTINLDNGTFWHIENDQMITVHCNVCDTVLGSKFVHVETPSAVLRAGMVMLCLEYLQLLTGEGILEATTLIPPSN